MLTKVLTPKQQKFMLPMVYFIYFIFLFFLNLVFISKGFHYDSISLASWAESKRFYIEGQQYHILLTLINYLFYSLCSLLFRVESALVPLTVLECCFGALGVIIFLAALNSLFENKLLAFWGSLGLAFSMNYWRYSILLETHIIPTVFLIISFYFLVVGAKRQSLTYIFYTGIFCCLSLFASGANIVFVPSFLIFIICTSTLSSDKKIQYILAYTNTILLCWFIPFLILGFIVFYTKFQPHSFLHMVRFYYFWLKGPLNLEGFRAGDLFLLSKNIVNAIFISKNVFFGVLLFYATTIFLSIKNIKVLFREYSSVTFFALVAAVYFLTTLLFYEPNNLQRYTPLLIFIWLIICLLVKDMFFKDSSIYKKLFAFSFISFLFINNLVFSIAPGHLEKNNFYLQEALLLKETSAEQDVIITQGGERLPSIEMVYIPYFAKRKNIISIKYLTETAMERNYPQAALLKLQEDIESALMNGRNVFILKDVFLLDTKEYRERFPLPYSVLVTFFKLRYYIKECARKDGVIIYKLTKVEQNLK